MQELLKRFPTWTVDLDNAKLSSTSTVRGWDNLPVFTAGAGPKHSSETRDSERRRATERSSQNQRQARKRWELTLSTPMGPQVMTMQLVRQTGSFSGSMTGEMGVQDITGKIAGDALTWTLSLTKPVSIKLSFDAKVEGDKMTGSVKLGMFGKAALTGKRI